jgi:D-threo-aldose 1-dehydrogenase
MNPFEKARIGRTDLPVTRLGLGTAALPGLFTAVDRDDAIGAIRATMARGLNLIDTAPMYGHGLSEELLGEGLSGFDRDAYVLSTKVGRVLEPLTAEETERAIQEGQWKNLSPFRWRFDFTRDSVMRSFEESLKRLRTDRIDILLIHDPDDHWEDAIRFAYPAIHELRAQGVVKAIGAGMNQWQMLKRFAEEGDFDCFLLAGRYTLIDHTSLPEFLPKCVEKGISILVGGPYNSGILAGGDTFNYAPAPVELREKVARMRDIAAGHGTDLKAAALQFLFAHPAIASVIPGARSAAELDENIALMTAPIPAALWREYREGGFLPAEAPVPGE